ncbi:MAG TPA: hypothetical protein VHD91_03810 [Gaiellaceae bacterium]|nr:hypothetical protein [Gaiellaceae bacterium]
MPTRKQRRRAAKEKRHEYETVWVDSEGNELDAPPEETLASKDEPRNGKAPAAKAKSGGGQRAQRTMRTRVPPPPSWNRAIKRAGLLGIVVFFLFYIAGGRGGNRVFSALGLAVVYTALFIPFTYVIDRFTHQRWQRKADAASGKSSARKR